MIGNICPGADIRGSVIGANEACCDEDGNYARVVPRHTFVGKSAINVFGYVVSQGDIRANEERLFIVNSFFLKKVVQSIVILSTGLGWYFNI